MEATLPDDAWATTPPLRCATVRGQPWPVTVERSALQVVEQLAASQGASMMQGRSRRLGGAAIRLRWARPTVTDSG